MKEREYRIVSNWVLEGNSDHIFDMISSTEDISSWWPSVFLRSELVFPGDENLTGKVVRLHSKGWLPYTFQLMVRIDECQLPGRIIARTWGDLVGLVVISGRELGNDLVEVEIDWRVRIKTWVAFFAPILVANHRYAMRCGEKSFNAELERKSLEDRTEKKKIRVSIEVPEPSWPHNVKWVMDRYVWREMGDAPVEEIHL
ncbi:MAG: hypothetical protein CMO55_26050 [Verrucomicrobiales bacterium]|nr:hypothetical protein [Verrucomicrobiales bacterium]